MLIKEHEVDWSPLADIKPVRIGRGYSLFTQEEGERIRTFWRDKQVCALWVARYFGVNIKTIDNMIYRRTKYDRPAIRRVSDARLKQAWLQHRDGMNLCDVARELGTPTGALRSQFQRRGWKTRKHVTVRMQMQPVVERLTREGMSIRGIAAKLGLSTGTVQGCRKLMRDKIRERETI